MLCTAGQGTFAMEALDDIGLRLIQCRRRKRLSRHQVSQLTGISEERLQSLEENGRNRMMTELGALTACFGVSMQTLLFGEDGKGQAH